MNESPHSFHVPVLGIGFSLDTPLRIGRFGISSVMSLVDDTVMERVRRHYCRRFDVKCEPIAATAPDARARRVTAYLDLVDLLLKRQLEELRAMPFSPGNDKSKYFELLAPSSPLGHRYVDFCAMAEGPEKERAALELSSAMVAGSASVNIMTKVDRTRLDHEGQPLGPQYSDAKAALRGFACSRLEADLVLSAGMNPTLFGLLESFPDFYRDAEGRVRKGIILKVSDFRSASIQGRFLAKKGIEVKELRIESGLNCGGHAFATNGHLLGPILEEFREGARELATAFEPAIRGYYEKKGWPFVGPSARRIRVTVQGGIGTFGETQRICEYYGADATGWGSPFLLVPEATAVDPGTRKQLADAKEGDIYLSDASPLGIPFNNLRGSTSQAWIRGRIEEGKPGSACPQGYLATNTEFTAHPICTASREYQDLKLRAMGFTTPPPADSPDPRVVALYAKECLCNHLGNGALIDLGVGRPGLPVAICPGPNLAYFDRQYSLREMVDHIYGRGESLVSESRPHAFAKELELYVDHFVKLAGNAAPEDDKARARVDEFRSNLQSGIAYYRALVRERAYPGENLASLATALDAAVARIDQMFKRPLTRVASEPERRSCAQSPMA